MQQNLRLLLRSVLPLFIAVQLLSANSHAGNVGFRGLFSGGLWSGHLSQSGFGHDSGKNITTSMGFGLNLGLSVGAIFFEYAPSWFTRAFAGRKPAGQYFAPLGFNMGIQFPVIPVDIFAGGDVGGYALTHGSMNTFGGIAAKGGLMLHLAHGGDGKGKFTAGIVAEYRRLFISGDDRGSLPDGVSTKTDIYFVGLVIGKR